MIPYDVSGEKFRDFCSDFGVSQLDCVYAHEREKLSDWEGDSDDYRTIGVLTVRKKVEKVVFNGVEEEEVEYKARRAYPPENDLVKIHQFWSLAWNGNVLNGVNGPKFLNQVKIKRKPIGEIGIRVLESEDDDWGRELTLREALGIDPIEAPFGLLGPEECWWKAPEISPDC